MYQGTYLGTLEGVNHLDLVGWINTARYKWAEFTGREIKFKPATFYLGVADHLARHVEGQTHDTGAQGPENGRSSKPQKGDSALLSEYSKAGTGAKTVEGVEENGPRTPNEDFPPESSSRSNMKSNVISSREELRPISHDENS